jgi:hypothetical protein
MLEESRFFNDGDYALDIHFDDPDYYNFFKESIRLGREVILDNSLYERRITGIEFSEEKYIEYILDLKPTYYIIPDGYNSSELNIKLFNNWIKKYNLYLMGYKKIAVIHGSDYNDYVKCYQYFDKHLAVDDIISFSGGDIGIKRDQAIRQMYIDGIINLERKHHILGLVYPSEIDQYYLPFINSIDTSLPIICTYENKKIDECKEKPKSVITKIFDEDINMDLSLLFYNIKEFRKGNK